MVFEKHRDDRSVVSLERRIGVRAKRAGSRRHILDVTEIGLFKKALSKVVVMQRINKLDRLDCRLKS